MPNVGECLIGSKHGIIPFHGDIVFYNGHWSSDLQRHIDRYEYCARFTNGRVEWIKAIEVEEVTK